MPVPVFTTAEILTSAAMNQVGTWLISSYTIPTSPAVASFTVPTVFSSSYDAYRIVLDTTFSNSGVRVYMRPASLTSGYSSTFIFNSVGNGTPNGATGGSGAYHDIGLSQAGQANAEVIMFNVGTSGKAKRFFGTLTTSFYFSTSTGLTTGTGASTDLFVEVQAGTMSGGTCRVYGMRN